MAKNTIDVVVTGDYNDKHIKRAISDLEKLQASSMSMSGKMAAVGDKMQEVGQKIGRVGKSLTVGVTLPIVGVGAAATKMAMDFDTSMTKMVSMVGLTRDEVDGMRSGIIDMASQYGKSANEAAEAMFFITSAGLRGSDAMETLEASLKGAAIGLGDVQTIADLSTSAMNAYGAANLSASQATSILRTAVEQGKLESDALASAMGSTLPLASALGVSFDQAAAAMAAMSRTGTDAAAASTQLEAIFSALVKETPRGKKALDDVGLSYAGLREQIRDEGLLSTLQTLVSAFGDNTIATEKLFGNKRALVGVMDLMGAGAATTEDIFGALASTTANDLNPAFEAASETTGFKLQQAFATLKNSLIEFGDVIAPFVEQFAARIKSLGESFQNLSPQAKRFVVIAGAVAAAIGPVLLVVGKLVSVSGVLIKAFAGITIAGSLLALKVIAIVAAVAAVAVAFKMIYDRSETLRTAVSNLIDTVKQIALTLINDVKNAFMSVTNSAGDLRSIFDRVATVAGDVLAGALRILTNWWKILASGVRVVIKVFETSVKIMTMTANIMRGVVLAAIDILFNKLGPFSTMLRNVASGVKNAFSTVANAVSGAFKNVGPAVEAFINFAIDAVNGLIRAYNKLAGVLPGVSRATEIAKFEFNGLRMGLKGASSEADHLGRSSVSLGNDLAAQRYAAMQGSLSNEQYAASMVAAGQGADEFSEALAGPGGGGGGGVAGASDKATQKAERFKAKFDEIANRLKEARQEIEQQYTGMAQTVQQAVMGSLDFGDALPEVDEEGNRVGGTFMERLNEQATKATEFAAKVRTLIQQGLSPEAITMVVQEGINAGTSIANELINGGATAIDETNRLVESTQTAATEIGTFAADHYYGAGLKLAKDTEAGFQKRFGAGGGGRKKLNRIMTDLANSLNRTSVITVVTRYVTQGKPEARRFGGPVAAGTPYIVGEAGPELFVPTVSGQIVPNNDLGPVSTGARRGAAVGGGGAIINVTVNAGLGSDGAEVGRQVVDVIKQYERRNGPVYVAA